MKIREIIKKALLPNKPVELTTEQLLLQSSINAYREALKRYNFSKLQYKNAAPDYVESALLHMNAAKMELDSSIKQLKTLEAELNNSL